MPPIGHTHSAQPLVSRFRDPGVRASAWPERPGGTASTQGARPPLRPTGRRASPCPTAPRSRWTGNCPRTRHGI
ncbi:hypothetical protein SAM23877_1490 [Streptomyces ambofaciens ATCC 23877]|uniref:Uncharacterized protein n=1 Tax=Streptomyces ambofaciens (strain ATCC 23877 / 3486 / DSM 40053 / JCM 4204 / NBRC 12836 / NRRL B-2516) TaxID=278992 RepID=A0A0K2ANG9_STRA7|nr:hypothetical protein SAM23877_1490 [Streptomyces ambofaciens ATCC 23877]